MDEQAAGPLYLASSECKGLAEWLVAHRRKGPVVVVTAASTGLADQVAIVDPLVAEAMNSGRETVRLDLRSDPAPVLGVAGAVLMPGGDPFRLLRELRASGAAAVIARRHAEGLAVAGQSAGAMVCGPTLLPVTLTSPFTPEPAQDLAGLGLTATLALPHHDRTGRAARHRQAAVRFGASVNLAPLWDGEVLQQDSTGCSVHEGALVMRPARVSDAAAIDAVFRAATQAAWASFLGGDRLRATVPDTDRWRTRIQQADGWFLVAEDAEGVLGFVFSRRAEDADLDPQTVGELDLLYTLPRAWGAGIGRRLLDRATFALLAAGYREAVLWTEARNERALAVYRRNGWIQDGTFKDRDYLGVPIRNLRHRFDLRSLAGGGR